MRTGSFIKSSKIIFRVLCASCLCFAALLTNINTAWAFVCLLPGQIVAQHNNGRLQINRHTASEFNDHRDWLTDTFAREQVIPALQMFTEQMSVVAMQQTMMIGMFLDAKNQLETQRLFQELQTEAHKDYQPSRSFCTFGTNIRSVAHSESHGRYNALVMARRQQARHLGQKNIGGSDSPLNDKKNRWKEFTQHYCDPQDNNWNGIADTGLTSVCNAPDTDRVNIDIDYTRMIENRRTLDISRPLDAGVPDEIDVFALGNNLYGHNVLFREISRQDIAEPDKARLYLSLRSIAAKRSVAENSYNAIVGMKSLGTGAGLMNANVNTNHYMGAILTELGMPEDEVSEYLGLTPGSLEDPSYYAQLEILAKKIYQNPDFFSDLYDKPANIKRKSAALKAIELMLDRAIYESQLRQEMAMSVLLSSRLRPKFKDIDKSLNQ